MIFRLYWNINTKYSEAEEKFASTKKNNCDNVHYVYYMYMIIKFTYDIAF